MAVRSQAKTLGGVGSILVFIPFVSLVGYILLTVAVKELSEELQDRNIFNNILVAAVTGIVGALAGATTLFLGVMSSRIMFVSSGLLGLGAVLLLSWVFLIVSAVFLKRAYGTMGRRLEVGSFDTAATLYLVGAALSIVVVGFLILFVAQVVQAVAYFSIPDHPPVRAVAPSPEPPAPSSLEGTVRFCTNCGTKISTSASYCYKCGSKQS